MRLMPEEVEDGSPTLKRIERFPMFSVSTTLEEIKNATITALVILNFCLRKARSGKSRDYRDVIVFEKFCFQSVFHPH